MKWRVCSFEGCGRPARNKGRCAGHHKQWSKGQPLTELIPYVPHTGVGRTCAGPACTRPLKWATYCEGHMAQLRQGRELAPLRAYSPQNLPHGSAAVRDAQGRKQCVTCLIWKLDTPENFNKSKRMPDGLSPTCRPCQKEYRVKNEAVLRAQKRLMTYKMSPEQYDALMFTQGGRCGSCHRTREETGDAREMGVDHDHKCCPTTPTCGNCNRGLLCRECNTGLGMFRDEPWRLMCGIIYLLKYRKKGPYGDAQAKPENT